MIQDFLLSISVPDWLLALLMLALSGLAFLYYYRTMPPLSPFRRNLVAGLRAVALALLLFIILEPVLKVTQRIEEKPVVAVLLDNSASMQIVDAGQMRGKTLAELRERLLLRQDDLGDSIELAVFPFALSLQPAVDDSLSFESDGTDLNQALTAVTDSLAGENLQAIYLVSDGIYNKGPNPLRTAELSRIPLHTVLVGDTAVPADVAVVRIQTNKVTYLNQQLPLTVTVRQHGFDGASAQLTIHEEGRLIRQEMVDLSGSGFDRKLEYQINPSRVGDIQYTVALLPPGEEVTNRNNQQSVQVRVLSNRNRILVLSGNPTYDRHFLSVAGDALENYEFQFLTERSAGRYYEGSLSGVVMDSVDLLILNGYPTAVTPVADIDRILEQSGSQKLPVLWFINKHSDFRRLTAYKSILPFEAAGAAGEGTAMKAELSQGGRLHPVTRLDDNDVANILIWKELPPLRVFTALKPKAGYQELLSGTAIEEAGSGARLSVCYVYRQDEIKQMVFNGANYGFWHFQLQEDPARSDFFVSFVDRAIRWLVSRDDIHRVQITPLERIYNVGETVVFAGQVYDEFYQPVSDAEVTVTVRRDSMNVRDRLVAEGAGFYRQAMAGLPEGEFEYQVVARRDDQLLGRRSGQFSVQPFYLEYQETRADYALMKEIAEESGGELFTPEAFLDRFPGSRLQERQLYAASEYFVWNYWEWLLLLVTILGVEWSLRKRWGLL